MERLVQREKQARSPTKSEGDSANVKPYKHTQTIAERKARVIVRFWKGWCGAKGGGEAIPPSCRQKICNIKMVGISQAESNNIKACALPSIHLPLTREASVVGFLRDSLQ